jgi:hypothetical protein
VPTLSLEHNAFANRYSLALVTQADRRVACQAIIGHRVSAVPLHAVDPMSISRLLLWPQARGIIGMSAAGLCVIGVLPEYDLVLLAQRAIRLSKYNTDYGIVPSAVQVVCLERQGGSIVYRPHRRKVLGTLVVEHYNYMTAAGSLMTTLNFRLIMIDGFLTGGNSGAPVLCPHTHSLLGMVHGTSRTIGGTLAIRFPRWLVQLIASDP